MADVKTANLILSDEQNLFIKKALEGNNILVEACIGSGKTTAIQQLCNVYPPNKHILYLTYNRLLKLDAQAKIKNTNVTVTNYHGFANRTLKKINIFCGVSELVTTFNKIKPPISAYDVLIIDEYQDIEQEFADMLLYIKSTNSNIQIVAVGDMDQKIYDKTTLDASSFIDHFLGSHITLSFTKCFRLSSKLAEKLGRIWGKTIVGVNDNCMVEEMNLEQTLVFLSIQKPKDILCLGPRTGSLADTLNCLESRYPSKFNKKTVYASIRDEDNSTLRQNNNSAIFTTFDSSKGLERPICIVFDYTERYWNSRVKKPQTSYKILRNIFCVAASRGKKHIIFVNRGDEMLSEESICNDFNENQDFDNFEMSNMFQFKYKEDVEECFSLLKVRSIKLSNDNSVIDIKNNDCLIDLSPCIGIYQETLFFGERSLTKQIDNYFINNPKEKYKLDTISTESVDEKILFLTSLVTNQNRYRTQVLSPFVSEEESKKIYTRLSEIFRPDDNVQVGCKIDFAENENGNRIFSAVGLADVVKEDIVYELKFVTELQHEHFLQCAAYVMALNLNKGIIWNTHNNTAFQIEIPDKKAFMNALTKTITKGSILLYNKPRNYCSSKKQLTNKLFAVIDTETNFNNEVMSIGIIFADIETYEPILSRYYILPDEASIGGIYTNSLNLVDNKITKRCNRTEAIQEIIALLNKYEAPKLFAYNVSFDKNHLEELANFTWCDIMWKSAYKQFNWSIPENVELTKTGRLKTGVGVQPTMQRLRNDKTYRESHNALLDAIDELEIIKRLGFPISSYTNPSIKLKQRVNKSQKKLSKIDPCPPKEIKSKETVFPKSYEQECPNMTKSLGFPKLSQAIQSFISTYSLDSSDSQIELFALKTYKSGHTSLAEGKTMLSVLTKILYEQPSPNKARDAAKNFYEDEINRALIIMPIEALSRNKKGIRLKYLKEMGYTNIYQLYKLSYKQLLSIYGIGPNNATNIVGTIDSIVTEIHNNLISRDKFSRTASLEMAIYEYYEYKFSNKIYSETKNILNKEKELITQYYIKSSRLKNRILWAFSSKRKKQASLYAVAVLQSRVSNRTQIMVKELSSLYSKCKKIEMDDIWEEYVNSSAEYNEWFRKNIT